MSRFSVSRRAVTAGAIGLLGTASVSCKPGSPSGNARAYTGANSHALAGEAPTKRAPPRRAASAAEISSMFAEAAAGRAVALGNLSYAIERPILVGAGGVLRGPGRLVLNPRFAGQWAVEFTGGTASGIVGVEIDGAAARAEVISGIRTAGSTSDLVIKGCFISNMPFHGIDVSGGAGAYRHRAPVIESNTVENVGWVGLNLEAADAAVVSGNVISRTGYHGLAAMLGCKGARITGNHVTKATAPSRIFSGPGSLKGVEGGFMIAFDPSVDDIAIERNVCDDNRRAGYDGIGVGEDGSTFGRSRIADNIVRRAGLFGIDAPGNCIVERNLVEDAAQQGIHVGLDLGGLIENVVVRDNIIRNTGGGVGARTESFGILVGDTLGPPVTIHEVSITGNTIADTRTPARTDYGIAVVSDEARYGNLTIADNSLTQVKTASLIWIGRGAPGGNIQLRGNRCRESCAAPQAPPTNRARLRPRPVRPAMVRDGWSVRGSEIFASG